MYSWLLGCAETFLSFDGRDPPDISFCQFLLYCWGCLLTTWTQRGEHIYSPKTAIPPQSAGSYTGPYEGRPITHYYFFSDTFESERIHLHLSSSAHALLRQQNSIFFRSSLFRALFQSGPAYSLSLAYLILVVGRHSTCFLVLADPVVFRKPSDQQGTLFLHCVVACVHRLFLSQFEGLNFDCPAVPLDMPQFKFYPALGVSHKFDASHKFVTSPIIRSPVLFAAVRATVAFYTLFTLLFTLIWQSVREDSGNRYRPLFPGQSKAVANAVVIAAISHISPISLILA